MLLPMVIIFGVLPKLFGIFKEVFVEKDKPKKKKKPKLRQVGFPPPPPPRKIGSRRNDSLREFAENYEVRGGRIVKKKQPTWEDEERFRRIRDGKSTESDRKVKDPFVELGTSKSTTTKKKHFSKGVDPDFL